MGTIYGPAVEGTLGKGSIAPLSQNSTTPYTITWKTLDEAVYSLSGMTVTGKFTDRNTGTDYSVSGTIALVGDGTAGQFTWTPSAADGGTAGLYNLHFKATNGTVTAWSYAVEWKVLPVPGASVTPPAGETTVSQAAADLIDSLLTLTGLAKFDGAGAASEIKIKLDDTTAPTVNEDSGDGYGVGSLWVDTTNDNIYICTDATVGAANWEQVNGGGAVSSVFGRTGAVVAASGDYAASEITDDSVYGAGGALSESIDNLSQDIQTVSTAKQDAAAGLTAISALAVTDGNIIVGNGSTWVAESGATARTSLGTAASGANSDITSLSALSTPLTSAQGGTGVSNAGTITNATNTTITGGGTLALAGFTLTVPATGTAALLGTYQTFTAGKLFAPGAGNTPFETVTTNSSTTGVSISGQFNNTIGGTPGVGFGGSLVFTLKSSTTYGQTAGRLVHLWNVATHASRVPDGVFYLTDYTTEREIWRGRADGTNAMIGFLGATPVARQAHIADTAGDDATAVNAILDVLEAFGLVATS